MNILDLHTHLPAPRPGAIISCSPYELPLPDAFPEQLYSVGFHPWNINMSGLTPADLQTLRQAAERPDVVAIGEAGIDKAREGAAPLFAQMLAFKAQIDVSEELSKPLIIHCVKAHDIVIGLRKEYNPTQRWIIHGFRGKPSILQMLLDAGIDVSYGELFNPESVALTPLDRVFAETDESSLSIEEIISSLHNINPQITTNLISANCKTICP